MASSAGVKPVADFARSAVPEGQGSSGLHIALIIIGGTIGFSIFIVAAQIGGALGYSGAAAAFALGINLKEEGFAATQATRILAVFSMMTPIGIVFGSLVASLLQTAASLWAQAIFGAIAAGTFL